MKKTLEQITCMVTGHRNYPPERWGEIEHRLREEVMQAVAEGFRYFLTGHEQGVDRIFANIIAGLRDGPYPHLYLEVVIPYPCQSWLRDAGFRDLLTRCNGYMVVCQQYSRDCRFLRNRDMILRSRRILAVTNGRREGETAVAINYGMTLGKEVRILLIEAEQTEIDKINKEEQ